MKDELGAGLKKWSNQYIMQLEKRRKGKTVNNYLLGAIGPQFFCFVKEPILWK